MGKKETIEERLKYRENLSLAIQNDVIGLSKKIKSLTDHDLETYQELTEPDCLFNDCPISHFWTYRFLKEFMMKKDMDYIGLYLPDGKVAIQNFHDRMKAASAWVLRFAKEKMPIKKGLSAIIKED